MDTTKPISKKMMWRLLKVAAQTDGVLIAKSPNWNAGTDRALHKRGLVYAEKVGLEGVWQIRITEAGRAKAKTPNT